MIEILFRGQKVDTKEWVYGDLVINKPTQTYRIFDDFANVTHGDFAEDGLHKCSGYLHNVIAKTVGQFTGLTDKNGVKIFSDDLLKDSGGYIFRIYQIDGGFCIKSSVWKTDINDFDFTDILIAASLTDAQMQSYILESCEIIGNIHDKHVL